MNAIEKANITNMLSDINSIKNKYDHLAEYTGENYNIFNVLNIYNDELIHSAIIGNLLNAKGQHGQKDTFLKLFLAEIPSFYEESKQQEILNLFKPEFSEAFVEKHIGSVNYENGAGGRIDILIKEGKNNIIIENKVWARDQQLQLIRYNNYDQNAPILFLTLDGKPPSKESINHENKENSLTLGKEFICISYQENITNWLEKCIIEMANKPIIRESLNQYLVLVKQLTNQSTNNKMSQDIIAYLSQDVNSIKSAKLIVENYQKTINQLIKIQVDKMITIFIESGIDENSISIERSLRHDGAFIAIKSFELEDGVFDLGINIELCKNYYFFCILRAGDIRKSNVNTNRKFKIIQEYLHSRISNLDQIKGYAVGTSSNLRVGINKDEFFYPNMDNDNEFKSFALTVLKYREILN